MRCCALAGLLLLGLHIQEAPAQSGPVRDAGTIGTFLEPLTTESGLAHDVVNCILQDRRGFLWFGTADGLVRYDGSELVTFQHDPGNPLSLSFNEVQALHEDRDGMLWVGTLGGGLNRFDPSTETFSRFRHDPSVPGTLSNDDIRSILSGPDDILWVGTAGGGLNRLDGSTGLFERIGEEESIGDDVYTIVSDGSGGLWLGLNGVGVSHFAAATKDWTHYRVDLHDPDALGNPWVRALLISTIRPGTLWVGTGGGVYRLDMGSGTFSYADSTSESVVVRAVAEDGGGNLWVGGGSLERRDLQTGARWTHRPRVIGSRPANAAITDILVDRSGLVWVATYGGGVHRIRQRREPFSLLWPTPTDPAGADMPAVWGALEDSTGTVWISVRAEASGRGALVRYEPRSGSVRRFEHAPGSADGLPFWSAGTLFEDRSGTIWIGSGGGGFGRFDSRSGTFEWHRIEWSHRGMPSDAVKTLLERPTEPGVLWIGTEGGGLARFDRNTGAITRYRHDARDESSLGSDMIHALHVVPDEPDVLWIGTWNAGLDRMDLNTGSITHFKHVSGNLATLSGDAIAAIVSSSRDPDILWIGVYGGGLNRFDRRTGRSVAFRSIDGLIDDSVLGLEQDDDGHLWISTNVGLSRFDPVTESFLNFDAADGLQGRRFYATARHYSRRSGLMYFGGPDGLTAFHPDSVSEHVTGPEVRLTGLALANQAVPVGAVDSPLPRHIDFVDQLELPYANRSVTLQFAALDYAGSDRVRYRYRLVGLQDEWSDNGNRREVTFPRFEPGRYVFEVMAAGSNGAWSPRPAMLPIRVLPPWWATVWFRIGALLLAAVGMYAAHRIRLRNLASRQVQLETEVAERTAEVAWQSRLVAERNQELRVRNRQIEEQSRRLKDLDAMKSRFFANISHEFRTPLTLILGPIEDALTESSAPLDQPSKRRLIVMQRSAQRLHRLIDQLLDLSRLESGALTLHRAPLDLVPILRGMVNSFASMAERRSIDLVLDVKTKSCLVHADAHRLEEVFINLLSNAFKFTPDGGRITVGCRHAPSSEQDLPGALEITVQDSGRGMAAEHLPFVFDRFYRIETDDMPSGNGTGIGLALARELVELHDGEIHVDSVPGSGSVFTVRLPLLEKAVPAADHGDGMVVLPPDAVPARLPEAGPVTIPERADAPTVLVVEDDPDVRAYIRDQLVDHYHVVEADDGIAGLECARATGPDLIIADVMMPRMDGRALCRAVKSDPDIGHVPVVLLTALASEQEKVQGLETGADDYLYKPFNSAELVARVENLIELRRLLRDRYQREVVSVQVSEASLVAADREFLDRAQAAVEAHLGDAAFSVEWLADEVALSPRQLQRRLKALTGMSAGAYIRCLRLQRAAQELEARTGTVSEIAGHVGFRDAEYFSRLFHQVFGVLPSKYTGD